MSNSFDVTIEKLVYGGDGLAHHEGQTVFVPYVLPGEIVSISPAESRKKFIRGHLENIVKPAAGRVAAPCPRFGVCGGCHYQHMPYEEQVRYKSEILRETLARIGRVEWTGEIKTHPSPPLGYRNRAQWAVRLLESQKRGAIGYFQQGSSTLVPTDVCPISSPRIENTLTLLAGAFDEGVLPPTIRAIEAFTDAADEKLLLNVVLEKKHASVAALAEKIRQVVPEAVSVLMHDEEKGPLELFGPGHISYEVAGQYYRVGHLSFFQVNRFLLEDLMRDVVGEAQGELALDLFAGVGLFSIPLAAKFKRVVAVEGNVAAARDLEANLKKTPAARSRHAGVESFLDRWREKPDLVVLDPPRAGVPEPALKTLQNLGPAAIVYLSCDPATLARDLSQLTRANPGSSRYVISNITLYDIFPQTYHIEALVRLQRLE
jgi:23S rRNA (uracil1939-C5)-methyltransferase